MESNELLNKTREVTVFLIGFVISLIAAIVLCIILSSVVDKHNEDIEVYLEKYERQEFVIDSLNNNIDSLNVVIDSLTGELTLSTYKIEQIKYYTDIVDNNASQIKFYKGWIRRVLTE